MRLNHNEYESQCSHSMVENCSLIFTAIQRASAGNSVVSGEPSYVTKTSSDISFHATVCEKRVQINCSGENESFMIHNVYINNVCVMSSPLPRHYNALARVLINAYANISQPDLFSSIPIACDAIIYISNLSRHFGTDPILNQANQDMQDILKKITRTSNCECILSSCLKNDLVFLRNYCFPENTPNDKLTETKEGKRIYGWMTRPCFWCGKKNDHCSCRENDTSLKSCFLAVALPLLYGPIESPDFTFDFMGEIWRYRYKCSDMGIGPKDTFEKDQYST